MIPLTAPDRTRLGHRATGHGARRVLLTKGAYDDPLEEVALREDLIALPVDDGLLFHQMHSILDWSCGWYQKWYFLVRLEEEILRSERFGHVFSTLAVAVNSDRTSSVRGDFLEDLAQIAVSGLRTIDIPGVLTDGVYAVMLPGTDLVGAETVSARLAQALARYEPAVGIGVFPEDGRTTKELLQVAFRNAHA